MDVTGQLASYVVETSYSEIPSLAVERAKQAIMDCVGVMLAGASEPPARIVASFVKEQAARPEAAILGMGFAAPMAEAAFVNGTSGHALDYDDYNSLQKSHPTVVLLPAALAVAEAKGVSGRALLEAYILGFEVQSRIAASINPSHYELGWHATATLGTIGAAVAAGKLLGLGVPQMSYAIGLAASEAAGLRQNFGTMTKPFHAGNSARSGVVAALLAERGFTADSSILDAPFGFANLFCGRGKYDPSRMVESLGAGDAYDLVKTGIAIKYYPCCAFTHSSLDAALGLMREHSIDPASVQAVESGVSEVASDVLIHHDPQTGLQGKFSMEYCLAAGVLDGRVGLAQFTDEKVQAPSTHDLLRRVRLYVHPDMVGDMDHGAQVDIALKDGTKLSRRVNRAKGHPDNPLSPDDLVEKYRDCASPKLTPAELEASIGMLKHLEELPDVQSLTGVLATADQQL